MREFLLSYRSSVGGIPVWNVIEVGKGPVATVYRYADGSGEIVFDKPVTHLRTCDMRNLADLVSSVSS